MRKFGSNDGNRTTEIRAWERQLREARIGMKEAGYEFMRHMREAARACRMIRMWGATPSRPKKPTRAKGTP